MLRRLGFRPEGLPQPVNDFAVQHPLVSGGGFFEGGVDIGGQTQGDSNGRNDGFLHDAIIAVRRRNLTPEQKTRLALFDNRASDLSEFDPLMLAGLQAEGASLDGLWTGDELDALLADLPSFKAFSPEREEARRDAVTPTDYGGSERGAANDRQAEEEMRLRRENTQDRQVSPRPPSADTEPYQSPKEQRNSAEPAPVPGLDRVAPTAETGSTAGLDRVTPDQETSRAGLFLHFRGLKIPLSAEEGAALDARLARHRETAGTYYGFIDALLASPQADLAQAAVEGDVA